MFKNLLASAVFALSAVSTAVAAPEVQNSRFPTKPEILEVLEIRGGIHNGTSVMLKEQVEKLNENPKVKGVLLIVQSPGGGVLASANTYEELGKIKVPVVAWCNTVCASGGMYIMMAPSVKYSAVRNSTISGSIGVVATYTGFNRLLDWAKIDNETFKSGVLKDTGNPTRGMTPEDRKYMQSIVDSFANDFYELIEKSRGSKVKDWDAIKSARIFIGKEGVKVGLVDAVMTYEEAVAKAKELSGSKTIFTREELAKIAKDANAAAGEAAHYKPSLNDLKAQNPYGDTAALIEIIKEVRQGSTLRFEYLMPYRF